MPALPIYHAYHRTTRQVTGTYLSQAEANAAAAADSDIEAFEGGAATAIDAAGSVVDAMLAEPGDEWYSWPVGQTLRQQRWDTTPRQTAVRAWHNRLHELSGILRVVGPDYPQWAVELGHDTLYNLHAGMWLLSRDTRLSRDQKIQQIQTSALGPNDMADGAQIYDPRRPVTIFPILAGLWESAADDTARQAIRAGAQRPLSVCQVFNASGDVEIARRSLGAMLSDTRTFAGLTPPTVAQLELGDWIERITE